MDAISQTTFSRAFSGIKMLEFWLKFHWNLFIRVKLTIFQHWFRWWLGADQATSHYLNQWWLVYRRIYASLGLNELRPVMYSSYGTHNRISISENNTQLKARYPSELTNRIRPTATESYIDENKTLIVSRVLTKLSDVQWCWITSS